MVAPQLFDNATMRRTAPYREVADGQAGFGGVYSEDGTLNYREGESRQYPGAWQIFIFGAVVQPRTGVADAGKIFERVHPGDDLTAVAGVVIGEVEDCGRIRDPAFGHGAEAGGAVVDENFCI